MHIKKCGLYGSRHRQAYKPEMLQAHTTQESMQIHTRHKQVAKSPMYDRNHDSDLYTRHKLVTVTVTMTLIFVRVINS